jgi:hypothetical protein
MFVVKQDLKNCPFQILHEKVTLAGRKAVENLTKNEEAAYERFIARKEKEWADTHEYPDEGSLRETHPYDGPSKEVLLEERMNAENEEMEKQIESLGLKTKALWLLPQLTAHIAKMSLTRTTEGKIDCNAFIKDNFKDDWHYGLYRYCTYATRGKLVPNQNSEQYRNYSAIVPLLMMPFKKFDGIQYSEWDRSGLRKLLDSNLAKAVLSGAEVDMTPERILENREYGLQIKSGAKAGSSRAPTSTYKLYGALDTEMSSLPWLCQVMLTQIWIAHPTVRTDLMILDWNNLDRMPEPLITGEVVKAAKASKKVLVEEVRLPWDD